MKRALRRRAYAEAAQILTDAMSRADLPDDLTESEEDEVREFIRNHIAGELERKSGAPASPGKDGGTS